MNPPACRRQLSLVRDAAARAWRSLTHEPVLARPATAQQARRRRAHADAYDELLMKRLAERDEAGDGVEGDRGLPGEEDALIDTALACPVPAAFAYADTWPRQTTTSSTPRRSLGAGVVHDCV